jgi:thioredoxin-like negative regulator of GroEL
MTDVTSHLTADLEPALVAPKALLYFTAPWCGPCKFFGPLVEEFQNNHPEIMVVKIDTDEKNDLCGLYGVKGIPTVISLEYGAERSRHTGMIMGGVDVKLVSMFGA